MYNVISALRTLVYDHFFATLAANEANEVAWLSAVIMSTYSAIIQRVLHSL